MNMHDSTQPQVPQPAAEPHNAWLHRVQSAHASSTDPERQAQLATRRNRCAQHAQRSQQLQTVNAMSSAAFQGQCMAFGSPAAFGSASPATGGGALFGGGHGQVSAQVGGLFGVSAQTSAPQALQRAEGTQQAFRCLRAAACSDSVGGGAVAMAAAQTQLAAAGHTWAAPGGVGAQAALDASSSALTALLAQLSAQPGTDEERAAKFGLYESHSETLSTQRTALNVLWSSCKSDFNGAAKEAVERELKGVDCHGNLELWEDKRHWFVYSMAVKANANQRILEATLAAINTRLQLLSSDADCPVCLESLGDAADVTALGCAHRCCSECWTQWSMQCQQTHTTPFCPLCRQEQFVDALFQAPAPVGGGLFGGAVGGGGGLFGGAAPTAAGGMFGGGAPAGGGMFGGGGPAAAGGMFGGAAGGGLFGGGAPAAAAGGGLFGGGAPACVAGSGLFGGGAPAAVAGGDGGLFGGGAPACVAGGGLFGGGAPAAVAGGDGGLLGSGAPARAPQLFGGWMDEWEPMVLQLNQYGFTDNAACRVALVQSQGNVSQAVRVLRDMERSLN